MQRSHVRVSEHVVPVAMVLGHSRETVANTNRSSDLSRLHPNLEGN